MEPSFQTTPLKSLTTTTLPWLDRLPQVKLACCRNEVPLTATRIFWPAVGNCKEQRCTYFWILFPATRTSSDHNLRSGLSCGILPVSVANLLSQQQATCVVLRRHLVSAVDPKPKWRSPSLRAHWSPSGHNSRHLLDNSLLGSTEGSSTKIPSAAGKVTRDRTNGTKHSPSMRKFFLTISSTWTASRLHLKALLLPEDLTKGT